MGNVFDVKYIFCEDLRNVKVAGLDVGENTSSLFFGSKQREVEDVLRLFCSFPVCQRLYKMETETFSCHSVKFWLL